jgi:hypothetical protein
MKKVFKTVSILILSVALLLMCGCLKSKQICGLKGMGPNYDESNCDISCMLNEDCKYVCGCGAINKNEVCHDEGIMYDCVDSEVKCKNNKCIVGEEIIH